MDHDREIHIFFAIPNHYRKYGIEETLPSIGLMVRASSLDYGSHLRLPSLLVKVL